MSNPGLERAPESAGDNAQKAPLALSLLLQPLQSPVYHGYLNLKPLKHGCPSAGEI